MSTYHRRKEGLEAYRQRHWMSKQDSSFQVKALAWRWFIAVFPFLVGLFLLAWIFPSLKAYITSFWPGITAVAIVFAIVISAYKNWNP